MQRLIRWYKQPNVWIPSCFFGMFLVIFAANATMIGVGMSSWRGLVTTDAYDKGVAYQQAIEAEQQEQALGWSVDLSVDHPQPKRADLLVSVTDAQGRPVDADTVRVGLVRPTQAGYDSTHTLTALGGGRFAKRVQLPLKGLWELRIEAEKGADALRVSRRITVTQ
ncbi:FixH family protein [Rhodovibrio sodomensis]|nr:FixH family protein [Rhodovibrio sodomensis]